MDGRKDIGNTMGGKYDVHNTKEVLALMFGAWGAIDAAKESDGKIDFNDFGHLMPLVPKFQPAIDDIAMIPRELLELDAEDSKDLLDFSAKELKMRVDDPLLIQKVNSSLQAAIYIGVAITAWRKKPEVLEEPVPAEDSPTDGA